MIIYQIHKIGGQYEDYYDHIIGSYLNKKRAEEEKIKAEKEESALKAFSKKCEKCRLTGWHAEDVEALLVKYPDYCTKASLEETKYGIDCENYYVHWHDNTFKIEEVEVEE